MGFLDSEGLARFFDRLKPKLVRGVTQAEYNALPEAERNSGLYIITDAQGGGSSGGSGGSGGGLPAGSVIAWYGSEDSVPEGWHICDGTNGTPDLRGRFLLGTGGTHAVGETGGSETVTLYESQIPPHYHEIRLIEGYGSSANAYRPQNGERISESEFIETTQTGGGKPHNNMPPYYTLFYIIKL